MFLHIQLSEALAKQVDIAAYPARSTVGVNVDEPPVNEDQANTKPEESLIRSDSKKKNTKKNQSQKQATAQKQILI